MVIENETLTRYSKGVMGRGKQYSLYMVFCGYTMWSYNVYYSQYLDLIAMKNRFTGSFYETFLVHKGIY